MRSEVGWRTALAIGLAVGLSVGAGLTFWLGSDEPGADPPDRVRAEALALELELESEARDRLMKRVSELEEDLNDLADLLASEAIAPEGLADPSAPASAEEVAPGSAADEPHPEAPGPHFDDAALAEAGLDPGAAARVKAQWERLVWLRLGLMGDATREGWLRSRRFGRENRELEADLRAEMGERDWEFLLYATGRPTRVIAQYVVAGSNARHAGIERGDTILRYDGERIFSRHRLRPATLEGEPGTPVWVELLRNGQRKRLSVRRGPLGIVLDSRSLPPLDD